MSVVHCIAEAVFSFTIVFKFGAKNFNLKTRTASFEETMTANVSGLICIY